MFPRYRFPTEGSIGGPWRVEITPGKWTTCLSPLDTEILSKAPELYWEATSQLPTVDLVEKLRETARMLAVYGEFSLSGQMMHRAQTVSKTIPAD